MKEIELPSNIGKVAKRALAENGLTSLHQLAKISEKELLSIHGVGPKAIRMLKIAFKEHGIEARMLS